MLPQKRKHRQTPSVPVFMKIYNSKLTGFATALFVATIFWSLCSHNVVRADNYEIRVEMPLGYNPKFANIYECPAIFYAAALLIEKDRPLIGSGGDENWVKKRKLEFGRGCELIWRNFTVDYVETKESSYVYEVSLMNQSYYAVKLEYFWKENEVAVNLPAFLGISETLKLTIREIVFKSAFNKDAYNNILKDVFQKIDVVSTELTNDNPTTIAIFLLGAVEYYDIYGRGAAARSDYELPFKEGFYSIYKELVTLILCLSFLFFIIKRFER